MSTLAYTDSYVYTDTSHIHMSTLVYTDSYAYTDTSHIHMSTLVYTDSYVYTDTSHIHMSIYTHSCTHMNTVIQWGHIDEQCTQLQTIFLVDSLSTYMHPFHPTSYTISNNFIDTV